VSEREVWRDPNGSPLKFQDGDYVRIDTSSNPDRMYTLPFLEGYVRGYDLVGIDGVYSAAYELFKMGDHPLRWVREEFLEKAPELIPHAHRGGFCGICGAGGTPQGLSIFAGPKV
jgi:hypothetical protein